MVDLTLASFVTRSSTLIGLVTRNEVERIEDVEEGAKAIAADAEHSTVTTASVEKCMVDVIVIQYWHTGFYERLMCHDERGRK